MHRRSTVRPSALNQTAFVTVLCIRTSTSWSTAEGVQNIRPSYGSSSSGSTSPRPRSHKMKEDGHQEAARRWNIQTHHSNNSRNQNTGFAPLIQASGAGTKETKGKHAMPSTINPPSPCSPPKPPLRLNSHLQPPMRPSLPKRAYEFSVKQ